MHHQLDALPRSHAEQRGRGAGTAGGALTALAAVRKCVLPAGAMKCLS